MLLNLCLYKIECTVDMGWMTATVGVCSPSTSFVEREGEIRGGKKKSVRVGGTWNTLRKNEKKKKRVLLFSVVVVPSSHGETAGHLVAIQL